MNVETTETVTPKTVAPKKAAKAAGPKKVAKTKAAATVKAPREAKIICSDANIGKAAMRLLAQRLVSTEIHYVQRTLGNSATQQDIDNQVLAVRKLKWSDIVAPE